MQGDIQQASGLAETMKRLVLSFDLFSSPS
jgi:hypothetical protein